MRRRVGAPEMGVHVVALPRCRRRRRRRRGYQVGACARKVCRPSSFFPGQTQHSWATFCGARLFLLSRQASASRPSGRLASLKLHPTRPPTPGCPSPLTHLLARARLRVSPALDQHRAASILALERRSIVKLALVSAALSTPFQAPLFAHKSGALERVRATVVVVVAGAAAAATTASQVLAAGIFELPEYLGVKGAWPACGAILVVVGRQG